jgi:NodT family efflux transporter outer membrane factor (OMF) lipoprotein
VNDLRRSLTGPIALVGSTLVLGACAVGPDFQAPAAPDTTQYTPQPFVKSTASFPGPAGASQEFAPGEDIPLQWWTLFRSDSLDALIRTALAQSPSLGAAQATLRQAQETLVAERGSLLFPSSNVQVQGARERASGVTLGAPGINPELTVVNATVNVSYNFDVFGGARRQVEGYEAEVDYANFQLEAAYLTLTSSVVSTAIKEASLRAQLQATREVLAAEEKELVIVRRQFEVGAIPKATLLSEQTQVATTRGAIPGLEKSLAQTRHQLSVLVGKLPSEAGVPEFTLDALTLPEHLPVSLPSSLVHQRPDIRASEATLHNASAQVGVTTAALYPQIGLSAQYGREGLSWSGLYSPANTIWSLGASVTQPLLNGGQLTAQRRAALAAYDAATNQYRQTVLLAFENVADSLRALDTDAAALVAQGQTEAYAKQTLDLTQAQYRLGAVSAVALLDAQRQYASAHVNLVIAEADRLSDTAALFQALGGGWWNRSEPLADISGVAAKSGS